MKRLLTLSSHLVFSPSTATPHLTQSWGNSRSWSRRPFGFPPCFRHLLLFLLLPLQARLTNYATSIHWDSWEWDASRVVRAWEQLLVGEKFVHRWKSNLEMECKHGKIWCGCLPHKCAITFEMMIIQIVHGGSKQRGHVVPCVIFSDTNSVNLY